jgi:uncharacterized repeat protein (TIGR02543 family)
MLILCGSSMSYMVDNVLAYKAPLYGRRTAQMKIQPFTFSEASEYFSGMTPVDKALMYGIAGGTPQYILQMDSKLSVRENIINTFTANTTPATLNLTFGIKTDNNLPSGKYSNNIVYTLAAKPQCLTYAITWNLDGGTAATGATYPAVLNFGATANLSTLTPTKTGYQFTGWSNGTTTFDGTETAANLNPSSLPSLTMTAQWTKLMAENLQYTPPTGVTCTNAQCMIDYLSNKLN